MIAYCGFVLRKPTVTCSGLETMTSKLFVGLMYEALLMNQSLSINLRQDDVLLMDQSLSMNRRQDDTRLVEADEM